GVKRKETGRLVIVVHDVSRRTALERERAEQRARLETVLRVLPVGLAIAEAPSGRLVLTNAEMQRIWGGTLNATSFADYRVFEGYWPDGRRVAPHEWPARRAIEPGEIVAREEIHIVASDGTRRITEHSAAPVRDASG